MSVPNQGLWECVSWHGIGKPNYGECRRLAEKAKQEDIRGKELGRACSLVSKEHGMEGKDPWTVARICIIERLNGDQSWSEELGWCTPEGQC